MMERSKYGNRKTEVDGIEFESAMEARRYGELKLLEQAGEIRNLELQPEFLLQPSYTWRGKHHRAIKYRADFQYQDRRTGWQTVVEDVKGAETAVFKLKRKLLLYHYKNFDFRTVKA